MPGRLFAATLPLIVALLACSGEPVEEPPAAKGVAPLAIAIHGGAGTILKANMTPEREAEYRTILGAALDTGYAILERGGSSLAAVEAVIVMLEDSPLFNAGRGAVFTHAGTIEMDASIMEGRGRNAGAVAGVTGVKNPIRLAGKVMTESRHVLLSGEGAEAFAREMGLEMMPPDYFETERRRRQLERARAAEAERTSDAGPVPLIDPEKYGTVGVVALDGEGNLAAGTSTGGTTNKRWGRVGDSPIIGAGTYADNSTCAVSATGTGEYFIRGVIAHDVAARMRYGGAALGEAVRAAIDTTLGDLEGSGGVIALDARGNVAMRFNTPGMYRAAIDGAGTRTIAIYGDEQ